MRRLYIPYWWTVRIRRRVAYSPSIGRHAATVTPNMMRAA